MLIKLPSSGSKNWTSPESILSRRTLLAVFSPQPVHAAAIGQALQTRPPRRCQGRKRRASLPTDSLYSMAGGSPSGQGRCAIQRMRPTTTLLWVGTGKTDPAKRYWFLEDQAVDGGN